MIQKLFKIGVFCKDRLIKHLYKTLCIDIKIA